MDLRTFSAQLKARGLKFKTIDRIYTCLSGFYKFLIIEELVEYNPILPFANTISAGIRTTTIQRSES